MNRFWDALEKSYLVTGLVSVMLFGITCYLWATGQPVPADLIRFDDLILGAFIGGGIVKAASRR